jgi:hypothetical protein
MRARARSAGEEPADARHPPAISLAREPAIPVRQTPDLARDPNVQRNVGYLADYDWVFDLQVFAEQMESAWRAGAGLSKRDLCFAARRHA